MGLMEAKLGRLPRTLPVDGIELGQDLVGLAQLARSHEEAWGLLWWRNDSQIDGVYWAGH